VKRRPDDLRIDCPDGGPVILSTAPSGRIQIDVGMPSGRLAYAELTEKDARRIARRLVEMARGR